VIVAATKIARARPA